VHLRSLRLLVAAALTAGTAGTALVATATVTTAAAGPVTLADITIPASDGVNLVGDVHLPAPKGRFPAIVDMEPYGRSSDAT
jgi:predicted acyl esterase